MVKLSVVVAAYNVEDYIERCLQSLVEQTYKNIEILVVNDGSTDNTEKIITKYQEEYKNVKLLNKENGGLSSARNFGIEKSKCEYITFVDGDDYLEKNAYELIMEKILEEESELGIFSYTKVFETYQKKVSINKKLYEDNFPFKIFSKSGEIDIVVWNKIFRRDIIIENNIYFENRAFFEDTGFIFRYLYYVKKKSIVDIPLYNYVQRKGSITKRFNPVIIKSYENSYNIIYNFYKSKENFKIYSQPINDMKLRMEIYNLNYFLINNMDYKLDVTWVEIIKTKIPIKHRLALVMNKLGIYQYVFKILNKLGEK